MKITLLKSTWLCLMLASPTVGFASVNGSELTLCWTFPFIGLLLSIALVPLFLPRLWHAHFGKIAFSWVIVLLVPFMYHFGLLLTGQQILHTLLHEYIPFIILLLTLFTLSGGIFIENQWQADTKFNIGLLTLGTVLASIMGTTGATMLLIRPLLQANQTRHYRSHLVIFFIFLVGNIGGGLTPLGDPPLFIGFLKGVSFTWTIQAMLLPVALSTLFLLTLFFVVDRHYFNRETKREHQATPGATFLIKGKINFLLLGYVMAIILVAGLYHSERTLFGIPWVNLARDGSLLLITLLSLRLTPTTVRKSNQFNWSPILEIAKLFAAIFITILPVIAILQAGTQGALGVLVDSVTDATGVANNTRYFWLSGLLSSMLDNAPTYLVFFNLASGDVDYLMHGGATTLLAISMGSVFMGALTYIGNAPNFMVKSIAEQHGVLMPSFFGYLKWSFTILIPLFLLLASLFFN